jgi:hypothetical protein
MEIIDVVEFDLTAKTCLAADRREGAKASCG